MRPYALSVFLMLVTVFALSTTLEPAFQAWEGDRRSSESILQAALGDGRKLFAKHFFTKADVYFHNGYYPTIYDETKHLHEGGLTPEDGEEHEEEREDFLGKPNDWIDAFSRHFFPARHTHLGDSGCGHSCCQRRKDDAHPAGHSSAAATTATTGAAPVARVHHCEHCGHDHSDEPDEHAAGAPDAGAGPEREILPWLRLSAELDPQRVETYVVASFWLRTKLGQVEEAEKFLREGLQANPGDYEILFELGRIYYENRQDSSRARNVWELALKQWQVREASKQEPDLAAYVGILNNLAMLEREQNNYPKAIQYYTALKPVSPHPEAIQAWIDYLKTNGPPIRVGLKPPSAHR
jgi:tetratricopeptide (TPR) repeat protein